MMWTFDKKDKLCYTYLYILHAAEIFTQITIKSYHQDNRKAYTETHVTHVERTNRLSIKIIINNTYMVARLTPNITSLDFIQLIFFS